MQLRLALWSTLTILWAQPCLAQVSRNSSPQPVSLDQFAGSSDITSPGGIQFISLRCGALHLFIAGILESQLPKMAGPFDESAKSFVGAAITVSNDSSFVFDQLKRMVEMYSERAKAAKANTGNMFADPILNGDSAFCKRLGR